MSARAPTLEELLQELEPRKLDPEERTTVEWAEVWKINPDRARALIKIALLTGRMSQRYVIRESILRPGTHPRYSVFKWIRKGRKGKA